MHIYIKRYYSCICVWLKAKINSSIYKSHRLIRHRMNIHRTLLSILFLQGNGHANTYHVYTNVFVFTRKAFNISFVLKFNEHYNFAMRCYSQSRSQSDQPSIIRSRCDYKKCTHVNTLRFRHIKAHNLFRINYHHVLHHPSIWGNSYIFPSLYINNGMIFTHVENCMPATIIVAYIFEEAHHSALNATAVCSFLESIWFINSLIHIRQGCFAGAGKSHYGVNASDINLVNMCKCPLKKKKTVCVNGGCA